MDSVYTVLGARGSLVGSGAVLQAGMSRDLFPIRSLAFFNLPNPLGRTRPWGLLSL
jgi:hypothetical protein